MLLWLSLVSIFVALAGDDQIRVTLLVDDREAQRLGSAQVVVDHTPPVTAPLRDDGSCPGDMPDDHILTACFDVQKRENLSFGVLDGADRLGAFNLFLPNASEATVSLRARPGTPALLLDMTAEKPRYSAPEGPGADTTPQDRILVMVTYDGSTHQVLDKLEIRALDRDDMTPVRASDAGLLLGDKPGDGVWRADLSIVRTDTVVLELLDGETSLGEVEFALPAKPRAAVRVSAATDGPGLIAELQRELPGELSPDGDIETSLLRISIEDSTERSLGAPVVVIEGQEGVDPVAASDDGLLASDKAGDGTWRADVTVQRTPTVTLSLEDGGVSLGKALFSLPAAREVAVSLVRKGSPARLTVTTEALSSLSDQNSMVVVVELDDRAAALLEEPIISVDQDNVEPKAALDDGSVPGDVAGDHIFIAELELVRNPRVVITVNDGDTMLGSLDAPLPSSDSTTIRIRTRHGSPPVALVQELDVGAGGGGTGAGSGNLWLIVWLNIGLFVVLVAWVRRTVRRAVQREVGARGDEPG